ncbi:MAG: hypothetical protein RSB99_00790 [Bacilli bacterium]
MKVMNNNSTKQVLLSVLGVAILVVAVVGVSFAFFTYSQAGTTENTITTGTLVFKYDEKTSGINLTNAVPITDVEGKALTGASNVFDFSVTSTIKGNTTISYEISAKSDVSKIDAAKRLDPKYVKVRLSSITDGSAVSGTELKLAYFDKLTPATGDATSSLLYTGIATASDTPVTKWYRLQMWMADTDSASQPTVMNESTNGKIFTIKVNVTAKDTGTK